MTKVYTENELKEMGMDNAQIRAILSVQKAQMAEVEDMAKQPLKVIDGKADEQPIQVHHNVEVHTRPASTLVPTSLEQIASYKDGIIVEFPPFSDGQPFVARVTRPSLLNLVKTGKIPNTLITQATSLFANGTAALNGSGKNSTNVSELFDVIDVIAEAALLQPTIKEIRSVGMELTDDQLMALFSYTQRGIKGLEKFRTE